MLKTILAVLAACIAVLGSPALAAKPDLAVYGRLPNIEDAVVSPDGTKVAIILTDGEKRFLVIRSADGKTLKGVGAGTTKLRGIDWAGDQHVIVVTSQTTAVYGLRGPKREYYTATDYDLTTGKTKPLLQGQKDAMNVILGAPMVRMIGGDPVVFLEGVYFAAEEGMDVLFRVNLRTGGTQMLDSGATASTDGWLVDATGKPVAMSVYDNRRGKWQLRLRDDHWRTVDEADAPTGSYGIAGFGRDGKSVLVWRSTPDNKTVLREYRADGTKEDLAEGKALDGLLSDPETLALLGGYALDGDDLAYTFFDKTSQKTWNSVVKAFEGDRVSLVSWSNNRRKVIVRVDSATLGPAYALVDLDAKSASYVGEVYAGLTPEGVSPVRSIRYKAADGLEITGYLTLPKGREPKNLPLIVLPHGGPEGRDEPGFDWWSQALASRGYAVLQPNFRGSEGFGWDFIKAGFGEWGKKMQTDLSDGVREFAKQGLIDPKRVCIVGASYGGYAALAGATLDRGVYRCAVSVAGPSDLKRFLVTNIDLNNGEIGAAQRYWRRFMGVDSLRDPDLAAISPAQQAAKADIPILLIHGKDDTVVRYDQSQAMADALRKAGKPFDFVTLDGEDHWLSRGASRLKMLTETVAFVEKHNPPD
ncbi:S9 family peptidase [uncultured Caulobacter sp.]|uniref:S9 family peptidase n=1 Tax=uncultured Caulobacter sp. TaxID=158749 RepID=UPI0026186D74|nr:S9 family peptidase [uncultured Caulobacter sp.]